MPLYFFTKETTLTDATVMPQGWGYITPDQMSMVPGESRTLVAQKSVIHPLDIDVISGGLVSDLAYPTGWDGATTVAPSKNAVFDALAGITGLTDGDKGDIAVSAGGSTWTLESGYLPTSGSTSLFRVGTGEVQGAAANSTLWTDNMYWDGANFKYRANGYAAGIHFVDGEVHFMIAPSGTAGATIGSFFTITKPLKLNADGTATFSGNVIVPSDAYGSGWNGSNAAPTKDAVYDKIESLAGTGTGGSLFYTFSTSTSSADPGSGNIRYNNAAPASVTEIYISDTSNEGLNLTAVISILATGQQLLLRQASDPTRAQVYAVSSTPTDNGTWFTIPVTYVSSGSGGLPNNNQTIAVAKMSAATTALGTMATQNANAVAITGGTIFLPVNAGGNESDLRMGKLEFESMSATSHLLGVNMFWDGGYFQHRATGATCGIHFDDNAMRFMVYETQTAGYQHTYAPAAQPLVVYSDLVKAHVDLEVPYEAYDATTWNGSLEVPTKDAVRDKIEAILAAGGYSDEQAQDAVGAMIDTSLTYVDGTPLLQRSALTGDVTAAAGSNATTIANDAVTYAKMQNVSATDKILGRSSVGSGDVEEIACTAAGRAILDDATASDQRTTLGLGTLATQSGTFSGTHSGTSSGTNTGDQNIFQTIAVSGQTDVVADSTTDTLTLAAGSNIAITTTPASDTVTIAVTGLTGLSDGDKGDITVSGSGAAWAIDNNAVTFAKMQAVNTDVLLGNDSSGTAVQEITCTAAGRALLDDAAASDQRTTLGLGTMATQNANAVAITGGTVLLPTNSNNSDIRISGLEFQGASATSALLMENIYYDGADFRYRTTNEAAGIHFNGDEIHFMRAPSGTAGNSAGTYFTISKPLIIDASNATFAVDVVVPYEVYDATAWSASNEAPTKKAVRDKIESLSSGLTQPQIMARSLGC